MEQPLKHIFSYRVSVEYIICIHVICCRMVENITAERMIEGKDEQNERGL